MEIQFKGNLGKRMTTRAALKQHYGKWASAMASRLSVLAAVESLAEVPRDKPERMHALTGDRSGQFAVDVSPNYRLIFEPHDHKVPRGEDGQILFGEIRSIRILEVFDYHG